MAEKEEVFSSSIKYQGTFSFKDFYRFCHDWLTEETGLSVVENKYEEKLAGTEKNIKIKWTGTKKFTDYFKFDVGVGIGVGGLKEIEIAQGNAKTRTNQGTVTVSVKGTLVRDYEGKFERSAFSKFLRGIYEKWVIVSRIEQFEGKIISACDEFLGQAKAYLDLEGRK